MQKIITKTLTSLLILSYVSISYSKPELEVSVSSNKVVENTSFQMNVELVDKSFAGSPNIDALHKDFTIVNSSRIQSSSWINGKKSSSIIWRYSLIPNKKGELTIPKIFVADLSSEPINIEVVESSQLSHDEKPRLAYLEVTTSEERSYVQQMITLKIKLHHAPSLTDGSLTEPVIKDAIVIPLGRDKRFKENNNGTVFYILEREYAIFPQKSGDLHIKSPIFDGVFNDNNMGMSSFDDIFKLNMNSIPSRATHNDITINIMPAPKSDSSYWLPVSQLKINQAWETKGKLRQGEPIVRTITTKAANFTAEQLPNLIDFSIEGANYYNDTPKFENSTEDGQLLGTRVDSVTYIPTREGRLDFPEIRLKWWDTDTKSFKESVLPGKSFDILPMEKVEIIKEHTPEEKVVTVDNTWLYIALISVTLLWLLTIAIWIISKNLKKRPTFLKTKITLKDKYKMLNKACKEIDVTEARRLIIDITKDKTKKNINTLSDIYQYVGIDTAHELELLDQHIFSNSQKQMDLDVLWQVFTKEKFSSEKVDQDIDDELPPLNP